MCRKKELEKFECNQSSVVVNRAGNCIDVWISGKVTDDVEPLAQGVNVAHANDGTLVGVTVVRYGNGIFTSKIMREIMRIIRLCIVTILLNALCSVAQEKVTISSRECG